MSYGFVLFDTEMYVESSVSFNVCSVVFSFFFNCSFVVVWIMYLFLYGENEDYDVCGIPSDSCSGIYWSGYTVNRKFDDCEWWWRGHKRRSWTFVEFTSLYAVGIITYFQGSVSDRMEEGIEVKFYVRMGNFARPEFYAENPGHGGRLCLRKIWFWLARVIPGFIVL